MYSISNHTSWLMCPKLFHRSGASEGQKSDNIFGGIQYTILLQGKECPTHMLESIVHVLYLVTTFLTTSLIESLSLGEHRLGNLVASTKESH